MVHLAHSDWMFEHSAVHHSDTPVDLHTRTSTGTTPTSTTDTASVLNTLWHQTDPASGGSSSTQGAGSSSVLASGSSNAAAPTLTVTSSALTVNAGGSVSLPISVSPASGHTSVTITGLTNYETITDQLDGNTFTPDHSGSVTLSAAEVNSGLSLASSYTGTDHPVNTLTVTAAETVDHHTLTSTSQSIVVTDPPASTSTSGSETLTLQVSGDQYNGDPQIEVFVDGQQVGDTYTVTADHTAGQTQTITITGNFDPTTAHQVEVQFVNDAWDGTSWWSNGTGPDGHDRNVYVESISLNGTTLNGSQGTDNASQGEDPTGHATEATMNVNGTLTFNLPAEASTVTSTATTATASSGTGSSSNSTSTASDTLTLQVSGDQYNGDPQIEVFVDGQQAGGTYTVTADHTAGQTQTITITGNFDPTTAHQVEVQFVNDAWDGTPWWSNGTGPDGHDRNVYVESISLNGTTLNGSQGTDNAFQGEDPTGHATEATMNVNGTLTFNLPAEASATTATASSGTSGSDPSSAPSDPSSTATTSTSSDPSSAATTSTSSDPSSTATTSTSSDPSSATTTSSASAPSSVGTGAGQAPSGPGFYVSPTGSDSNPGTLDAPFATLARAQQAMEGSSIKTTYVEGGTYNLTSTITLSAADSGETWQYYPTDGVDSAVLDGGTSVASAFYLSGATNVTINGLTMQNFTEHTVDVDVGSNGAVIENNNIGFMTVAPPVEDASASVGIYVIDATNVTVANNYLHDLACGGIGVLAYYGGQSVNGDVISGNVIVRADLQSSDAGGIGVDMDATGNSGGHVTITNNYISDLGASGETDLRDIYLDDNSSNVTVTGNVLGAFATGVATTGAFDNAILIHNGSNDTISGNIIDIGSGYVNTVAWYFDGNSLTGNMSGDTFTGNIVVSNFAGGENFPSGVAYWEAVGQGGSASWFTISNNVYWNYASGGQVFSDGNLVNDANPIITNPQISGADDTIASGSAVFGAPVNFTSIVGSWGPPGFAIPELGNQSTPS
jgi:Ca-dependent carbohydrate-binding module xylan-binding/Right handed beta helix region